MQYGNAANLFSKFYWRVLPFLIVLFVVDCLFLVTENTAINAILSVISLILGPLGILTILDQANAASNGENRPFSQSLKQWFRAGPILKFYGIILLFLIPAFILLLITGIFMTVKAHTVGIIFIVLTVFYLLYIIPRVIFSYCHFVVEKVGVIKSIKASFKITKGNYWYTLFSIILFYILFLIFTAFVIGIANAIILTASQGAVTAEAAKTAESTLHIVAAVIATLLSTGFVLPFIQALVIKLYERAKAKMVVS